MTPSTSYRHAAKIFGCPHHRLTEWCKNEGVEADASLEDKKEVFLRHRQTKPDDDANRDTTGVTWQTAFQRERARALKRDNDRKEREFDNSWFKAEWVINTFTILIDRLEGLPMREKSRLGLTTDQQNGLQASIDEIRAEFAAQNFVRAK